MKNLGEDEIVFRISPSGWTGLAYDYTETQAQVLWRDKKNGKIRGLTIRTQIDLREILAVISSLGVDIPLGLSREQDVIKYITSLNITLPHSPFKFIDFLVEKFNQDHQGRDLAKKKKKWWKNDHDFRYFDEIAGLVDFLEKEVKNLVDQGYQGEGLKEHLKSLIGFVLMIMAGVEKEKRDLTEERIFIDSRYLPPGIYDNTFNYLLSLTGCAGGGGSGGFGSFVLTSFGTAAVVENDKYGSREFECPHCHKNVVRPKDKLLEKCPYCGSDVKC